MQPQLKQSGAHSTRPSGPPYPLATGFPRNEENRAAFEEQTGLQPALVLFFDCPEEVGGGP